MSTTRFIKSALNILLQPSYKRTTSVVSDTYDNHWGNYEKALDECNSIEEWLWYGTDINANYNKNGRFQYGVFNSPKYYRNIIENAITDNFHSPKSISEYGCGIGRNLIYLYLKYPEISYTGYELSKEGVRLANKAANKFNLPIKYYQLDLVISPDSNTDILTSDLGLTVFALEQIPEADRNRKALENIAARTNMGTIHLEPVVENYPNDLKGRLSKYKHHKDSYLTHFEENLSKIDKLEIILKKTYNTAHNPYMYPSLYVSKKKS